MSLETLLWQKLLLVPQSRRHLDLFLWTNWLPFGFKLGLIWSHRLETPQSVQKSKQIVEFSSLVRRRWKYDQIASEIIHNHGIILAFWAFILGLASIDLCLLALVPLDRPSQCSTRFLDAADLCHEKIRDFEAVVVPSPTMIAAVVKCIRNSCLIIHYEWLKKSSQTNPTPLK